MKAGQKLKNKNGNEIFLFPLDNMYLTEARIPPEHEVEYMIALVMLPLVVVLSMQVQIII